MLEAELKENSYDGAYMVNDTEISSFEIQFLKLPVIIPEHKDSKYFQHVHLGMKKQWIYLISVMMIEYQQCPDLSST